MSRVACSGSSAMEAGRRAKSRTHGTAPSYKRIRRDKAQSLDRAEKQEQRRSSAGRGCDPLAVALAVRKAMGVPHPRFITVNWRKTW